MTRQDQRGDASAGRRLAEVDPGWGDGTRCVHAGHPVAVPGEPVVAGPVLSTQYHLAPPAEAGEADIYGRSGNPTWRALEQAIGELDGGRCVVFPSGMAAIATLLRALLRPGDVLVLPSDGYFGVREWVRAELSWVSVREVPTAGPWSDDVFDDAVLVLLETPSNPGLDVCDIRELSRRANTAGAMVAVDNTTATPLGQRPLELGADIVVASDTKALTGHSDLVLGHVTVRDADLADALRRARTLGGAIPGPFETWLALRSLGTLDLRLGRQAENARAVAELLRDHPAVRGFRWPGWEGDPAHAAAARQMRRFGGVLGFELPDADAVRRFLERCRLVGSATSFGGLHTTADRRARWGDPVPEGFLRLSVGCEDTDDLVADLRAALDGIRWP
ncbi:cystathionine gamma-lyase [Streptoalloteichus tenebrarius]|uniref:Cystathionine gamma-lyase n=1 Tax=Streptoalloteichus tenebrarius (strain ATCC 17920 / DSM 40477 / JCM 4838 / CBS 697.72 / NBRC 16177 / NCIMB 11028 / NRRL B-12390 / A12253. 1 / ISP 5477) TaxID=1933 RepID=A0ABT1HZI7_STRSD|nr:cystathionine gamma-lyase [Streptoalloteichus tenebrarius]MCP2260938.1 cystathionine gamma-lyase [Streptoalloteichus tenebrarius]BFF03300.1 cystathionine gamma-lyase [Streptoalloteichus tenebrarius]